MSLFGNDDEITMINYIEFYKELNQPLNEMREKALKRTWAFINKGNKTIPVQQLIDNYKPDKHPFVISGQIEIEQAQNDFIDGITELAKQNNGVIDYDSFYKYYCDIGNSIISDAIFSELVSETWSVRDSNNQLYIDRVAYLEETLIEKVRQRCKPKENNEKALMLICRFYDTGDTKTLSKSDFENVLRNYGMLLPQADLDLFFDHYVDLSTGEIPYRDSPDSFIPKLYLRY